MLEQVAQIMTGVPPLEVLKARLDGTLNKLVYWNASISMAGGWNLMVFKGLYELKHSMIL